VNINDKNLKQTKGKGSKGKNKDSDTNDENTKHTSGLKSAINYAIFSDEPLMDEAEGIDGELWLSGNRTLVSLNLSSISIFISKK
jgi:hypothetical protein